MKLSTPRYTFCLISQLVFMFCDLIFNCVSLFPKTRDGLLVLFMYVKYLTAGLVEVLIRKFRAAGSVIVSYLAASVLLHTAWLMQKWSDPESVSTPFLIVLFTFQRCLSPWYYFFYKRAALRVSDPRFYEDIDWISQQLQPNH
ncbi:transmembrane protein 138-like isoform X2 [Danaus plexippus]|uniref:transmembrane protein 138-like isoform X2 n=1 Tax=Danaus plexippus TaxID=13037 RepID=UPI002AB22901|nr:transmembrane protein 138-like isoform X2 [Danaus plexippus]